MSHSAVNLKEIKALPVVHEIVRLEYMVIGIQLAEGIKALLVVHEFIPLYSLITSFLYRHLACCS